MPNTRRRRFSVQRDIVSKNSAKNTNGPQSSHIQPNEDIKSAAKTIDSGKNKKKNRSKSNGLIINSPLEVVTECDSYTSETNSKKDPCEKNVTVSSSNGELSALRTSSKEPLTKVEVQVLQAQTDIKNDLQKTSVYETRRDKYPRQHRVKVRSPKRHLSIPDYVKVDDDKVSEGTDSIDWDQEMEALFEHVSPNSEPVEIVEELRVSNDSFDDMCRICHGGESLSTELGQLISACGCRGTVGRVHVKCLERWLTESGKSRCELCGTRYTTRRVHRYGVPRAFIMWILSQNAKQLLVDSLGIMLMSPLAVLAAWLSGRTLAGLMTQDSHVTPWPLASTFVLACMTLVCYYCWIVSAATRHALGWWIWYRSQYEVRLQLQENED